MAQTRILIVSDVEEAKEGYGLAVSRFSVPYDVVFSFKDGLRRAMEEKFTGIVVDILTLLRSGQEEKLIANDFFSIYPTLKLSWDKRNRQMSLGLPGQASASDPEAELASFINGRCAIFPPRSMRRHERVPVCLNVLLSGKNAYAEAGATKTFTVNLSESGAFIHTIERYALGDAAWFVVKDLSDPAPIQARVCRTVEWGGTSRLVPGIGVEFEQLSGSQQEEIRQIIKTTPKTGR
ncbi:PilZ domain-containing protein [Geomesophilobacter sediminis]|uniref:PilZ domain-containing protein n=1 Tax=Geomesophilobacter sediminis TaxID=2798584 RepID=A0A8J7M0J7_9BACT|nr:PilZ domain-containing protein [Geomesophilobacter sediminis]MBJ6725547.1 PilZ domain-containing protein [Geomesophilobacter sediminis]